MKNMPLAENLLREPHRFDFFQAVRVLERIAAEQAASGRRHPVGEDYAPRQEAVRFRVVPSQNFPAGEIVEIQPGASKENAPDSTPPEMVVAFLGLTGPNGVLPRHYTSLLIERVRAKDHSLRDFLDLFHHRLVSLFYRAWEKYRFPIAYERLARAEQLSPLSPGERPGVRAAKEDLFTDCLYCLLGFGTNKLRGRLNFDDEALLYYAGFFAHYPRNAVSLEGMLADYFELAVGVRQFLGQWLYLSRDDQSALPSAELPEGLNCQLGRNVIVGERVWDIEGKFRVRVGPLGIDDFRRFMPDGDALSPLGQMIRSYAGPQFEFDVQPVLKAAEVPWCRLGGEGASPARLGWNTWIRCNEFEEDADDAVFGANV
ncbi:MAG: type VI secretion system baseplate subunit TssG [Pirellulales bacterium]|nr:type VI secretion system baseplate subunit TssG [Pirellulales bacterium]